MKNYILIYFMWFICVFVVLLVLPNNLCEIFSFHTSDRIISDNYDIDEFNYYNNNNNNTKPPLWFINNNTNFTYTPSYDMLSRVNELIKSSFLQADEPQWNRLRGIATDIMSLFRWLRLHNNHNHSYLMNNIEQFHMPLVSSETGLARERSKFTNRQKKIYQHTWSNVKLRTITVKLLSKMWKEFLGKKQCELPDGRTFQCIFSETIKSEEADALSYHLRRPSGLAVLPHQREVMYTMESEGNYGMAQSSRNNFMKINTKSHPIIMSYRYDSDVPLTYMYFLAPDERRESLKNPIPVKRKKRALYLQSHCVGFRDAYVRELMNHYPVDAGGRCLRTRQSTVKMPGSESRYHNNHDIQRQYRYTIAFENSVADWYVTEKAYLPLRAGSVPIYYGAPNAHLILPKYSVIFASDYKSPKHLATYLKYLDEHEDEYMKYHQWRYKPLDDWFRRILTVTYGMKRENVHLDYAQCRLCTKILHECTHECACGGRLVNTSSYYDGHLYTHKPP